MVFSQALREFQFVQPGFPSSYWGNRIRGAWSSLKLFVSSNLRSLLFPSYWRIRIRGAWSSLTLFLNSNLWGVVFSQAIRDFQLVGKFPCRGTYPEWRRHSHSLPGHSKSHAIGTDQKAGVVAAVVLVALVAPVVVVVVVVVAAAAAAAAEAAAVAVVIAATTAAAAVVVLVLVLVAVVFVVE